MTDRQFKVLIGAAAAAAVAVITYVAGQGLITVELATALNAIVAGLAGYTSRASS